VTARHPVAVLAFLALLGNAGTARAVEIHPFYATHFSPLVQAFGLPRAEDGQIAPPGATLTRLVVEAANSYHAGVSPRQSSALDGETWRATVALRYGFGSRFEGGVDVPVVNHSGGFLDGFIEWFHRAIGDPKNDGKGYPQDQLHYVYTKDGATVIQVRDDTTSLGDVTLSAAWGLTAPEVGERSVALRATLKLPTGKESALTGSGGTEGTLRLAARDAKTLGRWNATLFASAGALCIGSNTFVGELRRPLSGFGTIGAGWSPASWMAVKFQAEGHTGLSRDTEFKPLGWSVHLMGGFTFALPGGVDMDLGIDENILREMAPDVGFHLGFRKRFGG